MVITYYGLACFKLQVGDDVVAIDPFGKGSGLTPPRFEAHTVLLSDPQAEQDTSIAGDPLVCSTPGEYESHDIVINGLETPESTAFWLEWEGLRLLHLGDTKKISSVEAMLEHIDTVDILFFGAGGSTADTQKIISAIEPRIIVLMNGSKGKGTLEALAKEIGEKPEKLDKLTIKKKGLPAEGQRLVILDAPNS